MLKLIQLLEDKLATLLDFVRQLQEDNRQLRERVQHLEHEKRALQERMNTAQACDHPINARLCDGSAESDSVTSEDE